MTGAYIKMLIVKIILITGAVCCALAILIAAVRTGKPVTSIVSSALTGIVALLLISATGSLTGAALALNGWTLLCAGAAGIPGVVLMLAVKLIWNV